MRAIIQQGETIRLYSDYIDVDSGDPFDPLSLTCTFKKPDGVQTIVTYPNTNFVKETVGTFFVRILGDMIGTWSYRITATINANDIDIRTGRFDVEPAI